MVDVAAVHKLQPRNIKTMKNIPFWEPLEQIAAKVLVYHKAQSAAKAVIAARKCWDRPMKITFA